MVLKSRVPSPDWGAGEDPDKEAKCRKFPLPKNHQIEDDPWFHDMEEATPVCNGDYDGIVCPFREFCLYRALVNNEQFGVFGGLLPVQRRWIRREIPRDEWDESEKWRDRVPSLEYFEELERADDEEDADEAEAV
jgi:hypothetical protein